MIHFTRQLNNYKKRVPIDSMAQQILQVLKEMHVLMKAPSSSPMYTFVRAVHDNTCSDDHVSMNKGQRALLKVIYSWQTGRGQVWRTQ